MAGLRARLGLGVGVGVAVGVGVMVDLAVLRVVGDAVVGGACQDDHLGRYSEI